VRGVEWISLAQLPGHLLKARCNLCKESVYAAHQRVFAPKCVNVLVEDCPPSNRTHPQLHQGAERDHLLQPLRLTSGSGLL